ncbi:MAG: hypothetical protein JXR66_04890 [Bacteroidales bacterium]|nr:hypothetical protein [Bacteroidales bacterium]
MTNNKPDSYGYDRDFLREHAGIIELKRGNSAVAIVPGWQGRVMTSTAEGDGGFSYGWINHNLIALGEIQPHMNAFGGEERLWLGPEGGQFSIFFKKGDEFIYENWQTPAFLDTIPFEVAAKSDSSVLFCHETEALNYSGTPLKFRIEREVTLMTEEGIMRETGIDLSGLSSVSYRSVNRLRNTGALEWTKESGLLSVWMLGMFIPSPSVVVVIPYNQGDEKIMGPPVNDKYFGSIAGDRLKVSGSHIFFRADGKSRGKIGIPPLRAKGTMGSYDSANNILTLLICRLPEGVTDYVNSAWEIQEKPYSGDALNSYNDGPLEDGSQMGPFYELESSSPAAALKPGEELTHTQFTLHLTGNKDILDSICRKALGLSLAEAETAFM